MQVLKTMWKYSRSKCDFCRQKQADKVLAGHCWQLLLKPFGDDLLVFLNALFNLPGKQHFIQCRI